MGYQRKGYVGQKMSVRAAEAYEGGEKPLSKWSKGEIVSLVGEAYGEEAMAKAGKLAAATLRDRFLERSSWHHTGKYFRETDFYSFSGGMDAEALEKALAPAPKAARKEREEEMERWALVSYESWERAQINRYGKMGWRKAQVVAVASWKENGLKAGRLPCRTAPDAEPEGKELSSCRVVRELSGKPRKNSRIWKLAGRKAQ